VTPVASRYATGLLTATPSEAILVSIYRLINSDRNPSEPARAKCSLCNQALFMGFMRGDRVDRDAEGDLSIRARCTLLRVHR